MNLSTICLVPARGGSKRLPGKNIASLAGKSLLAHTADALQESEVDMPVLLSTDSAEIAAHGERLGFLVPFLRPAALSTDEATSVEVALHALDWWAAEHRDVPNWLLLLQPTSPLRGGACIAEAVALVQKRADIDAVVGGCELHVPISAVFVAGQDGFIEASHDGRDDRAYVPNGGLYLVRSHILQNEKTFFPKRTQCLPMTKARSVDIDTREDLMIAEALYQQMIEEV